jgi:poly-gamma-glutamate capsule biosynthesis protein CapA/YwtB (metallophosphatase superfamily)
MVGDIMMGSTYPNSNLPPDSGKELFINVDSIIKSVHLSLGNLEGTLLSGGMCTKYVQQGRTYAFRTPPVFAQHLVDAGFDFMNLANNHMNDFGQEGIESTIESLEGVGIKTGGPHGKIGVLEIDSIKIAIVCFATSPGTNILYQINEAQKIVAEQARKHDIVIVSFHGGKEGIGALHTIDTVEYFLGSPRGNVVSFSRAVIDSGADLVWGHGPHVPRALEIYKDRLIAYSLGNFCTWGFNISGELGYAPILQVVLDATGKFKHGKIISAIQNPFLEIDMHHSAAHLIKKLSSEDFPHSSPHITDEWIILPRQEVIEEIDQP